MGSQLSVIIPTLNEAEEIERTLDSLRRAAGVETLVVDGCSTDGTAEIARRAGVEVVDAPRGRASQMNAGARAATGEFLLFLHADTRLPEGFDRPVKELLATGRFVAGAFRLRIDGPSRSLRLIESVANWRSTRLQMPYGDQAIFLRADLFHAVGGYGDLPFMEDFELVRRLRRLGRIGVLRESVVTSARR